MATPIRGANSKGKGNTTTAVSVGTARSGGIRKVGRPSGYGGRISSSARGGLSDSSLGANNRGSGGKGAPGTGLSGGGGGSAGGSSNVNNGVTESTTGPGGVPTPTPTTSGTGGGVSLGAPTPVVEHATLESTFAQAVPVSSTRLISRTPPTPATPSPAPLPLPSTVNGTQKGTAAYQGYGGPTGQAGVNQLSASTAAANQKAAATAKAKAAATAQAKAEFNAKRNAAIAAAKKRAAAAARQAAYNKSRQGYGGPKGKAGQKQAAAAKAAAAKKAAAAAAAKKKAAALQQGTHGLNRGAMQ